MPDAAWLVVIDAQRVFADPGSPWTRQASPQRSTTRAGLLPGLGDEPRSRASSRRRHRPGAGTTLQHWAFARGLRAEQWSLINGFGDVPVVDLPTLSKWGPQLEAVVGMQPTLVLCGVSSDCCVLSTALAAIDAGARVRVVADACAADPEAHSAAIEILRRRAPLIAVTSAAESSRLRERETPDSKRGIHDSDRHHDAHRHLRRRRVDALQRSGDDRRGRPDDRRGRSRPWPTAPPPTSTRPRAPLAGLRDWSLSEVAERAAILRAIGAAIREQAEELAELAASDVGTPLASAASCTRQLPARRSRTWPTTSRLRVRDARRHAGARARAGRRGRLHHALELPAAPDRREGRPRARGRVHRRGQAERGRPADRAGASRSSSTRSACPPASSTWSAARPRRRRGARVAPRRRHGELHRLGARRHARRRARGRERQARHARARRQVAERRARRHRGPADDRRAAPSPARLSTRDRPARR